MGGVVRGGVRQGKVAVLSPLGGEACVWLPGEVS
jgi:hypothetical protein